jgi:hypothetical protein
VEEVIKKPARPQLSIACVCEKVLREEDGVLSAIRIVDTFTVDVPEELETLGSVVGKRLAPSTRMTALVALKSNEFQGTGEVTLRIRTPSGKLNPSPTVYPVLLKGGEHGANFIIGLEILANEFGRFGVEILWNGDVLGTIPFLLKRMPRRGPETESS